MSGDNDYFVDKACFPYGLKMPLCTDLDLEILEQVDLIDWYNNHRSEFRAIGREEYLALLSKGNPVLPTAEQVAEALPARLLGKKVFFQAFAHIMFHDPKHNMFFAGPLARYMLDNDSAWITH